MDIGTGSCVTFTDSLRVQEHGCKIVPSHFDFIKTKPLRIQWHLGYPGELLRGGKITTKTSAP